MASFDPGAHNDAHFPLQCPPATYGDSLDGAEQSRPSCSGACPLGAYCETGTVVPTNCTLGSYCPLASAAPASCPGGTFGARRGLQSADECTECPAGSSCPVGSITHTPCGRGTIAPSSRARTCELCAGGKFQATTGQTACNSCVPGHYCAPGAAAVLPCTSYSVNNAPSSAPSSPPPGGAGGAQYEETAFGPSFQRVLEQVKFELDVRGSLAQKQLEAVRDRALEINPRGAELYNTVADLCVQNRLYREAAGFAREAVRLDPRSWRGHGLLGLNLLRLGRIEEGRRSLETAFEGDPALYMVGYVQETQIDLDRWAIGLTQMKFPCRIIEVPTIPGAIPSMIQGTIDDGMREGIPSEDWGGVVTLYDEPAERLVRFTGNETPRNARVLLLDGAGTVVWFHDRGYSPRLMLELDAAVRRLKAPKGARTP